MEIIPSVLIQSEQEFLNQTRSVLGAVNMIQLDIADGQFVPNTTWADPEVVEEKLEIDCELHLMVQDPLEEVRKWEYVPQIKRVLVHYESDPENTADILAQIHSYGWEVGVVLNPDTPIDVVENFVEEIDAIMFMGVKPGFQAQSFIPETLERIREFKSKHPNIFVEVDGGVNKETIANIAKAGADASCPGSAVFGSGNAAKNVQKLKELSIN